MGKWIHMQTCRVNRSSPGRWRHHMVEGGACKEQSSTSHLSGGGMTSPLPTFSALQGVLCDRVERAGRQRPPPYSGVWFRTYSSGSGELWMSLRSSQTTSGLHFRQPHELGILMGNILAQSWQMNAYANFIQSSFLCKMNTNGPYHYCLGEMLMQTTKERNQ